MHDERQPVKFRSAAYHGLFSLRGIPSEWNRLDSSAPRDFPFPDGVDWPFVDSFLDESRTRSPIDPLGAALPNLSPHELGAIRLYRQGVEALERGEYGRCIQHLNEAIALQPNAAGAHFARGRAYIALSKLDDAVADFSRAAELNPDSVRTLRERGRVYRLMGAVRLAEQDELAATEIEEGMDTSGHN